MFKKVLIVLLFLAPGVALAHTTGFFIERTADGYFFDIGYSTDFVAGDFVRFDFGLGKAVTKEPVTFSDVWVRISEDKKLLFAGPIASGEFGKPGFSFVFPEAGDYTLSVRYENGLNSIAEQAFPLKVKPGTDSSGGGFPLIPVIFLAIGLIVGFVVATLLKKNE